VEENTNLVEKDETKDEGILMTTNEGITLDSDMMWYLDTSASNHMCGHKHLFVDIQEIEDGQVSFKNQSLRKNMFFLKGWENKYYGGYLVSILTILKDLMKPCKTCPASQSKQVEVCSRSCLSVSEYDWPWKRTYAHLRRNLLAHGLNDLNQTIKRF